LFFGIVSDCATVVFHGEPRFALRVLADRDAVDFERAQLHLHSGGLVDGFHDGVDRSVGGLIADHDTAIGVHQLDRHPRRLIVVRGDAQGLQRPGPHGVVPRAQDQRFDVAVEELLLLVGQHLEFVEESI
jgi:hypothetical protein